MDNGRARSLPLDQHWISSSSPSCASLSTNHRHQQQHLHFYHRIDDTIPLTMTHPHHRTSCFLTLTWIELLTDVLLDNITLHLLTQLRSKRRSLFSVSHPTEVCLHPVRNILCRKRQLIMDQGGHHRSLKCAPPLQNARIFLSSFLHI